MSKTWYDLVMGDDNRVRHSLKTSEHDFFGVGYLDLKKGNIIERWDPRSWLRSNRPEDDGEPDDILSDHLHLPTFSPRLQQGLASERVGVNDIQYLPVRVLKSHGGRIDGFAIANVTSRIRALDYEKSFLLDMDNSSVDPQTGKPMVRGVGKIAAKSSELEGFDVIRLVEFFPAVLVSGPFVEVFRLGKFTGATFVRLTTS